MKMERIKLVGILKNARSFSNYPALMVLVLFGVFGAIVWNQQVAQENSAKEDEVNAKEYEKTGMLLVEASCNKKKMFRQLLVQNNIGQQYAVANFDEIYDAAKAKNKKNCSLLTRPVALAGIDGNDSFTNTTENTQNLTTTVLSFHPIFSKWWCSGAIKNILLPNTRNQKTCKITERVSATNTKPTIIKKRILPHDKVLPI